MKKDNIITDVSQISVNDLLSITCRIGEEEYTEVWKIIGVDVDMIRIKILKSTIYKENSILDGFYIDFNRCFLNDSFTVCKITSRKAKLLYGK